MSDLVNPGQARTAEYGSLLKDAKQRGICCFCPGNLAKGQKRYRPPKSVSSWRAVESIQPYPDQLGKPPRHHLILFPKRHIVDARDLTRDEWGQLLDLIRWGHGRFGKYGIFLGRLCDEEHTAEVGRTVSHLHFHFIFPTQGERAATVVASGKYLSLEQIAAMKSE